MREVRKIVAENTETLAKKYVEQTGNIANAAFIVAGHNTFRYKKLKSDRLGDILSAPLVAKGDGTPIYQSVDKEIIRALNTAATRRGGLSKGSVIKTSLPDSGMFGVRVKMTQTSLEVRLVDADCFDYLVYYPKRDAIAKVEMKNELISQLDFREMHTQIGEEVIEEDVLYLTAFVRDQIEINQFPTVGGNIFVTLVTPAGVAFPTGEINRIRDGNIEIMGNIFAKEGVLCYRLPNGQEGQYRHLESINEVGRMELI